MVTMSTPTTILYTENNYPAGNFFWKIKRENATVTVQYIYETEKSIVEMILA